MSATQHNAVRQAAHEAAENALEHLKQVCKELDFVIRNGGSLPQHDQELLVIARARVTSVYRPLELLAERLDDKAEA